MELKTNGGKIYERIRQAAEARVAEDGDAQDQMKAQGLLTALFDHISDVDLEHRSAMRIQKTWRYNKRTRHMRMFQMQNEMMRQLRELNARARVFTTPQSSGVAGTGPPEPETLHHGSKQLKAASRKVVGLETNRVVPASVIADLQDQITRLELRMESKPREYSLCAIPTKATLALDTQYLSSWTDLKLAGQY